MTEWFEEWFGEEYLRLYPHRNDADAEQLVGLITGTLSLPRGARVLDVACGAGRHARVFRELGFRPIGLDLSRHLLARAREVARVPLVRCDMRVLPVRDGSVDLVVNLFTSFGYFEHDADHQRALAEMLRTVRRSGGWFVLDFLNAELVRRTVVPAETSVVEGAEVKVERWLHDHDRYVVKSISVPDGRQFVERVRLYDRSDLVAMITDAGGRVEHQFGSYDGHPPHGSSPRTILMARLA